MKSFTKLAGLGSGIVLAGMAVLVAVVPVSAAVNKPPVANFTYTRMLGPGSGNKVLLNGGSSYDLDGTVASYKWYRDAVFVTVGKSTIMTMDADGSTEVTLVVTDNKGATGSITKTVLTPNNAPTITSVSPVDGATTDSTNPTLWAVGKDADGDSLYYYFRITNNTTGYEQESGLQTTSNWTVPEALESGDYTWTVTVTDYFGASSAPRTSTLHVVLP